MATTPFGGPVSTILGSVLLGAGISGLVTDITTAAKHQSFSSTKSFKNWGVSIGIGAAGGAISGGFAAGAAGLVSAGEAATLSTFSVGGAGRIAVNVIGGVIGNGLSGMTQEVLGNINPYNPSDPGWYLPPP